MNTNGLLRFIVIVIVLFLIISVGEYFLFKPSTTTPPNAADINVIYQVVGEFGARLKDVNVTVPKQEIITAVDFNLKRLITDGLYQEFVQDTSKVPGRTVSSPWPERVEIVSVQKEDDTSYTVNGKIIGMTSVEMTQGGNAGETSITFTLKKVKGTWLIDEVK
jgi:hypothetical protein